PAELRAVLPDGPAPQRATLERFPGRAIPEGFWYYDGGLTYSTLLQERPAPLVFVIAGTGADDRSRLMILLARTLHAGGAHVVLIPSPSHANFIVTAGSTFMPGNGEQDAADLLKVMDAIRQRLAGRIQVTRYDLTGYSLGAWHAAFVARADAARAAPIGFGRVLLINPPLSLYHSIQQIDAMLYRGLPQGIDGLDRFLARLTDHLAYAVGPNDPLDFSGQNVVLELYQRLQPSDESLATTIGLAFRLSTTNLIFTSDVMNRSGYVFPRGQEFRSTTPLGDYLAVALRLSFTDYFNDLFVEHYAGGGLTRQDLIDRSDLRWIGGWLAGQKQIGLITNADDVILAPGDLDGLREIFGDRASVHPHGGHMGNLAFWPVVEQISGYFTA
ncbi:alpha/beta hydrolase, partial [Geminicoccus harenae]|uniref:alpha/beta hydrolase n=2 Tax=Geminicoccus harenae TaxID=2498453 RepID=UPI00168A876C